MWKDRDKIETQPMEKTLVSLAVPAVLSTFFTIIFEIVDMFWIGKLGTTSVAALSAASFFVWILRGLALTVATGSIALVSRRSGEKDQQGLLDTISNSIAASFLFSIIMMGIFLPLSAYIFKWINLDPGVGALAEEFSVIFLSGLIFVYMMMTLEYIIRGVGDTRTPMLITGLSLLLNALLDPLFIFQFKMGFKGAAYATILSQAVGTGLMAVVLVKKIPLLKGVRFSLLVYFFRRYFFTIIRIGAPVALSDAGFSCIYLVLSGIISIFGKEPLAAIGIAHRLEALPFFISLGFSMAVATMVGQYLGAGKIQNAKESVYLSLKAASGILLVVSVVFFLFAPALFRFFIDEPEIIGHGANYLRIIAIFEVFLAFEVILGGAFSGAGDTRPPFLIIFPITLARIPFAYLFALVFKFGIIAVWAIISLTTFLKGILLFLLFKKGNWAKKKL